MLYYSTNGQSAAVSLREAVIGGLAPDGGLYMPVYLPKMSESYFRTYHKKSFREIAFDAATTFLEDDIPKDVISSIVYEAFDFPFPLKELESNLFSLELFHGPTMAFKDVGARFMSRLMSYLYQGENKELNVIVATSGDTGSAVAAGFYNVPGINVFVLFPREKVSPLQKKQLTTWGGNIHALEVDGSFDDCQKLARGVIGDRDLGSSLSLTSANSINIGRLIPQSFYYFYACSLLAENGRPVVFSVPSGNFGNLTGGLMAKAAGLPVHRFIASTNINDVFPRFMDTGKYLPYASKQTMSNAMDVGDPSNFTRINEMMGNSINNFRDNILSFSFTDTETSDAIQQVNRDNGYIMDPHGAVACLGAKKYLKESGKDMNTIFLETAHPAKFSETMKKILPDFSGFPPQLKSVINKEERFVPMENDAEAVRSYVVNVNK